MSSNHHHHHHGNFMNQILLILPYINNYIVIMCFRNQTLIMSVLSWPHTFVLSILILGAPHFVVVVLLCSAKLFSQSCHLAAYENGLSIWCDTQLLNSQFAQNILFVFVMRSIRNVARISLGGGYRLINIMSLFLKRRG